MRQNESNHAGEEMVVAGHITLLYPRLQISKLSLPVCPGLTPPFDFLASPLSIIHFPLLPTCSWPQQVTRSSYFPFKVYFGYVAAAAAKSLQSCPTL